MTTKVLKILYFLRHILLNYYLLYFYIKSSVIIKIMLSTLQEIKFLCITNISAMLSEIFISLFYYSILYVWNVHFSVHLFERTSILLYLIKETFCFSTQSWNYIIFYLRKYSKEFVAMCLEIREKFHSATYMF